MRERFRSARTLGFGESVIRDMSRQAARFGAVNLAQGFPDFPAPDEIKAAAAAAIDADINQYAVTWGAPDFRRAIAEKYRRTYALEIDPDREVTVVCGSTEGMIASLLAVANEGDEVVIFEPFYENYGPDTRLCGATRKFVRLHPPHWRFDPQELRAAFSSRTKAIIVNTPNNPTGRVFTREELTFIAELCQEFDCLCLADEIYEHIVYDGRVHIPIMTLPGMRERTVLINSLSKTYSVTGWRVGWVLAAPDLTDSIRKVHDFLTVGAAAPLQRAGVTALQLPESYYVELANKYQERRDFLRGILQQSGFEVLPAEGAYYLMAQWSRGNWEDDEAFTRYLVENIGIAAVPGSSFFEFPNCSKVLIRFCFCKRYETLKVAEVKLASL